jgi:hypothetical protein
MPQEKNVEGADSILKKKIEIPVKTKLVIAWILYIPVAIFIFGMSVMAGDDASAPFWQVLLTMLLLNGFPLAWMINFTISKIKGRKTSRIFLYIFLLLMLWGYLSANPL